MNGRQVVNGLEDGLLCFMVLEYKLALLPKMQVWSVLKIPSMFTYVDYAGGLEISDIPGGSP